MHFDHLQLQLAGVVQAVHFANRDVGALVFGQQKHFAAVGHLGRALHHDPVLGAVVVFLQAQAGAGFDADAFDLEALAHVDAVVPAPGPGHAPVQGGLWQLRVFEVGHHVFDLLGVVALRHQQGVGRVDDQQVLRAQRHHRAPGRVDVGVARLQGVALAGDAVALAVGGGQLGHGVPTAHVAPLAHEGQHRHVLVVFHHRVVDAL